MQPCTLCNMPVCTLPYFFSAPSFGFLKSSFLPIRLPVARICYYVTGPRNKPTNKPTNKQRWYSSQTVHYACSTVHCLSFVSIGHVIFKPVFIYFIFILFCPLMIKLYRRVFFFVKLPPVIEPQQCKEIVCSRNKRNKNWVCCLLFV